MKITKNFKVPTGNIMIAKGEKNRELEFLSLGDYGKEKNVKAHFLNLEKDINGVPHGNLLSLEEKWVVTISSQYGCSMMCKFCDVPKVGRGINVTLQDLTDQVINAISVHPEIQATKRLNIHYARMGEPTFNFDVLEHAKRVRKDIYPYLNRSLVHPVVSTMLPKKNNRLMEFLQNWCEIKNYDYRGDAGLQLSINTTSKEQREYLFSRNSLDIESISKIGINLPDPKGRKYALNFALSDDSIIDAKRLKSLFHPAKFMVKITPLHQTESCGDNNLSTSKGYEEFTPYKKIEEDLKEEGFDVLVFVPSYEEDLGRITCGNAILSGTKPETEYTQI